MYNEGEDSIKMVANNEASILYGFFILLRTLTCSKDNSIAKHKFINDFLFIFSPIFLSLCCAIQGHISDLIISCSNIIESISTSRYCDKLNTCRKTWICGWVSFKKQSIVYYPPVVIWISLRNFFWG